MLRPSCCKWIEINTSKKPWVLTADDRCNFKRIIPAGMGDRTLKILSRERCKLAGRRRRATKRDVH